MLPGKCLHSFHKQFASIMANYIDSNLDLCEDTMPPAKAISPDLPLGRVIGFIHLDELVANGRVTIYEGECVDAVELTIPYS